MLENKYNPQENEKTIAALWQKHKAFTVKEHHTNADNKKFFTIMMPPPNVTGQLHVGHALNYTLQDILVRYKRMHGYDVLWQSGMDHAGIATQMLVEKQLAKQNQTRTSLGREEFIAKVWEWKKLHGNAIIEQQKKLGLSIDWSRHIFTLDPHFDKAVKQAFLKLYKDQLIYRDEKLVNWDCQLLTAVSDLEVNNVEQEGSLWYINYYFADDNNKYITVATTRPETLFGDSAIAVHPDDTRYKHLIGKVVLIPLLNKPIPIIADSYCQPDKGSGAVKITPAHDFNDFEVGKRHNLDCINIIDERGYMCLNLPKTIAGMERFAARKIIVTMLNDNKQILKIVKIKHFVPYGDRSNTILEPRLTKQWFINMQDMAKQALQVVEKNITTFIPNNNVSIFYNWLENIQPWCISRQLWWGHRIPVWYGNDGHVFVAADIAEANKQAAAYYDNKTFVLTQEDDVLDTWFSSGLWPFATLGWPEKTQEMHNNYPNNCLTTGDDILFFWVARMLMLGIYFTGKSPFKEVFFHSLILDKSGQKMSKTKGNVINPLSLMDEYGTDALRLTMAHLTSPNRDIRFSEQNVENSRNFITKLWNIAKFMEFYQVEYCESFEPSSNLTTINLWIVSEFITVLNKISQSIKDYRFDEMANTLYQFVWKKICDWYLEMIKSVITGSPNDKDNQETRQTLGWIFAKTLHLLHPIIPFITEKLWHNFTQSSELLTLREYPRLEQYQTLQNKELEENFLWLTKLITDIRGVRKNINFPAKASAQIIIHTTLNKQKFLTKVAKVMAELARLDKQIKYTTKEINDTKYIQSSIDQLTYYLCINNLVDIAQEKQRLQKKLHEIQTQISILENKLQNQNFISNAPVEVIKKTKQRLQIELAKSEPTAKALKMLAP